MKTKFIKSAVQRARDNKTEMPFARGARRAGMIARRKEVALVRKSA